MESTTKLDAIIVARNLTLTLANNVFGTIQGTVNGEDGKPLAGADVQLELTTGNSSAGKDQLKTDAKGNYTFSHCQPNSMYYVFGHATGYTFAVTNTLKVAPGQTIQESVLTIPIADSFAGGTVVDAYGNPIPNIEVDDNDIAFFHTITDKAGHFMITGAPRKKTTAMVQEPGGGYKMQDIICGRGDNIIYIGKTAGQK